MGIIGNRGEAYVICVLFAFKFDKNANFEFVFEQVMETSIFMFFELLTVDTGCQTSSYGGGNAKDVSNKKRRDDDNDELYRARRIARTVARSCPRKVVRRGFRR